MKLFKSTLILIPLFMTTIGILGFSMFIFTHEISIALLSLVFSILLISCYKVLLLKESFFTKGEFMKIQNISIILSILLLFIGIYHKF